MREQSLIKNINDMLSDMDDEQLHNCLDYITDEYDEKNHEAHILECLLNVVAEKQTMKILLMVMESKNLEDAITNIKSLLDE